MKRSNSIISIELLSHCPLILLFVKQLSLAASLSPAIAGWIPWIPLLLSRTRFS
ncbi:hypothetical protein BDV38DRAFT_231999 [Aspergillus pseudotamarii]|uniref:Uncharacterized protein n=1 Tax=Aspergillus pseudotamarii TaxID=132259 RepID=A0A5N6TBJ4_ASPPS|nr:uncharacterized protein BDV38DRAFT_231999 [Aspergillus pseudotamarii]KAE8143745.1 hypothetical protein BDV38DRAFT_231999 [Aspergillus pseudotamarii]